LLFASLSAAVEIEELWEFGDPAASEQRFREALGRGTADDDLELQTQLARTYSLRRRFDEAHRTLDAIEPQLPAAAPAVRARYLLERGRTLRSSGQPEAARPRFLEAYDTARSAGLTGLAVDAAHMLAIVTPLAEATQWTATGIDLARTAAPDDRLARGLLPPLLNNQAWNLHDAGRYDEALALFMEAETAWLATGRQPQGRIATWSVARALRSLGRHDDALVLLRQLEAQWQAAGGVDGYVFEEMAENLDTQGRAVEARPYFARAAAELGKDPSFAREHAARLQRLSERGRAP
jgi:tetratricopeptide (TPR) repeat protein